MKWKGVEITELSDDALRDVHERCLRILAELNQEMTARKLWLTSHGNEVQRTPAPPVFPPEVRTPSGIPGGGNSPMAMREARSARVRRPKRDRRPPKTEGED